MIISHPFTPTLGATSAGGYKRFRPPAIRAMDASQLYDRESQASDVLERRGHLKIAIVGFGNFGQFLAQTLARQGHNLLAHSRSDHSAAAASLGATFFSDPNDLCEQHPDVVLLSTSILSTTAVLRSLPIQRLRRNTLFADVLSSGKNGWVGLPLVFEKVRIGDSGDRADRCKRFLDIFQREGCRMVEMSCAEHDANAAESQFLTHTVGRLLAKLDLKSSAVDTKGYEALLNLVENTCSDSFELYNGLFMYNKNSTELLERLIWRLIL
ncbi:hypothetical protein KSP40_PGU020340 [Platanthera guangdongensis]|uniref:Pyrroline-5-carboxylate reductase catalytic N-terminal domain-containing protein n=1 Tax=Platanthera guangdongensis TaxID=2320717 RepID=A0ABR2LU65_9ASPA